MDFSQLTRLSSKQFNQQKNLIKAVLAGKTIACPQCGKQLKLAQVTDGLSIRCDKGCTDILLDAEQK
jgi:phage FluMu protein Com